MSFLYCENVFKEKNVWRLYKVWFSHLFREVNRSEHRTGNTRSKGSRYRNIKSHHENYRSLSGTTVSPRDIPDSSRRIRDQLWPAGGRGETEVRGGGGRGARGGVPESCPSRPRCPREVWLTLVKLFKVNAHMLCDAYRPDDLILAGKPEILPGFLYEELRCWPVDKNPRQHSTTKNTNGK